MIISVYNSHTVAIVLIRQVQTCSDAYIALSSTAGSFAAPYYEIFIDWQNADHYGSGYEYAIRFVHLSAACITSK